MADRQALVQAVVSLLPKHRFGQDSMVPLPENSSCLHTPRSRCQGLRSSQQLPAKLAPAQTSPTRRRMAVHGPPCGSNVALASMPGPQRLEMLAKESAAMPKLSPHVTYMPALMTSTAEVDGTARQLHLKHHYLLWALQNLHRNIGPAPCLCAQQHSYH